MRAQVTSGWYDLQPHGGTNLCTPSDLLFPPNSIETQSCSHDKPWVGICVLSSHITMALNKVDAHVAHLWQILIRKLPLVNVYDEIIILSSDVENIHKVKDQPDVMQMQVFGCLIFVFRRWMRRIKSGFSALPWLCKLKTKKMVRCRKHHSPRDGLADTTTKIFWPFG